MLASLRTDLSLSSSLSVSPRPLAHLRSPQMPVADGLEATRRIRVHERALGLAPSHVIALTAHASEEDRAECLSGGFDNFMCARRSEECKCSDVMRSGPSMRTESRSRPIWMAAALSCLVLHLPSLISRPAVLCPLLQD